MYLLLFNMKKQTESNPFFCCSLFGCLLSAGELSLAIVTVTVTGDMVMPLVEGAGWREWVGAKLSWIYNKNKEYTFAHQSQTAIRSLLFFQ